MALSKPRRPSVELDHVIVEEEVLGRGSYGVVYKVALKDGKKAAGKELYDFLIDGGPKSVRDRFVQERRILKGIEHSNIVRFYGVYYRSPQASVPILIMELMRTSLDKWLTENSHDSCRFLPPFTDDLKLHVLKEIIKGLTYIHNKNLIHRDLTAKNILISMADEVNMIVKIADFGVAKFITNSGNARTLTKCPGTPCYMPPEAKRDQPEYDSSLDIYSFGVVMVFIFTGELPESHPRKQLKRIRDHHNPKIRENFLLVERCLAKFRPSSKIIEEKLNGAQSLQRHSWKFNNPGLNIKGVCKKNDECIAHNEEVVCSIESDHFDLARHSPHIKCPNCYSHIDPVTYIMYQCSWELRGRKWISFSQPPESYERTGTAFGDQERDPLEHQREGNWLQLAIDITLSASSN